MTYAKLKLNLKKMKLTIKDFAILIGMNPTNLNKWSKSGVPTYAINFVELLETLSFEDRVVFIAKKIEGSS